MNHLTTKGPGDEATWGPVVSPSDPRYDEPDHVENLLDEAEDSSDAQSALMAALAGVAERDDLPGGFFEGMRDGNYYEVGYAIYNAIIVQLEEDSSIVQSWIESKREV